MTDTDKIIEILLILFFPPLAIWFHAKACVCHVCLNLILLCCFVLPAIIHAIWYCFMRDKSSYQSQAMLGKTLSVLLLLSLFVNTSAADICTQLLVTGPCRAYFPSFGYDAKKGECVSFVYGGCQGNENRFESKEACESKCVRNP